MVKYVTPARGIRKNTHPLGKGFIICPRISNTARAVLDARGQILQTEGNIMCPMGGVFPVTEGKGGILPLLNGRVIISII